MADITPLLLDAKSSYTQRLKDIIQPRVFHTFSHFYAASQDSDEPIIAFQDSLYNIPFWNASQINAETQNIVAKHPYYEELMAALIVTHVKILSSIRLSDVRPNVQLKLPTTDEFTHELYKQAAGLVYVDPYMFGEDDVHLKFVPVIDETIERSIRRLLPMQEILASYLAEPEPQKPLQRAKDDGNGENSDEESDSDDDDEEQEIRIDMGAAPKYDAKTLVSDSDDDDEELGPPPAAATAGAATAGVTPPLAPAPMAPTAPVVAAAPSALHAPIPSAPAVPGGTRPAAAPVAARATNPMSSVVAPAAAVPAVFTGAPPRPVHAGPGIAPAAPQLFPHAQGVRAAI